MKRAAAMALDLHVHSAREHAAFGPPGAILQLSNLHVCLSRMPCRWCSHRSKPVITQQPYQTVQRSSRVWCSDIIRAASSHDGASRGGLQ